MDRDVAAHLIAPESGAINDAATSLSYEERTKIAMRVLIIGSGAREHALAWKLTQSRRVTRLFATPGNPGIEEMAECIPIGVTRLDELADFAERRHIDL